MKKIFKTIIPLAIIFLFFGADCALGAVSPLPGLKTAAGSELMQNSDLMKFLGTFISGILGILGVALVLIIIYAGIVWGFLSANDPKKVQTAKDMIKNAVIGLIIVFASYAITNFVIKSATGLGSSSQPLSPTDTVCGPGGC